MKILITGIAGFIGSHCAERFLHMGFEVIGIDNFSDYYSIKLKTENVKVIEAKGAKVFNADLRSKDFMNKLDKDFNYIFHFAAQPGLSKEATYEDYFSNNVTGTENILHFAMTNQNFKFFVYMSTSSVYGLKATSPETAKPNPASYYGKTKLIAERLVLEKHRSKNLNACSLRLYSVIGPRERPEKMFTKLIESGLKDKVFPLFEGSENHLRSFTYVGDIIDGVISVIGNENKVNGEIINLGSEVEHTTKDGIITVEKVIGKPIKIEIKPKRPGDQIRTKANIDKARKLLGYNPQTTLLESVEAQVKWFKENHD